MMTILFLNNDGGGFADTLEIPVGMTLGELVAQRLPHADPEGYLIRVNRQPATATQRLQPGDRVSLTPTRIEGAA